MFFFQALGRPLALHSFPTRRSSDLYGEIERIDKDVRAFITLCPLRAFEEARRMDERIASGEPVGPLAGVPVADRKSTRLNSSHVANSYAVFCLRKTNIQDDRTPSSR